MNKVKSLLLICAAFFLFSQISVAQNRFESGLIGKVEKITNDEFTFETETSKGAKVYSVNKPDARLLRAIDDGLTQLFATARKYRYSKRLNYSDYTIFIARPDRLKDINNQYSPDIAVGAAQYAGSIYDKGGYIYAAGMVAAYNPCAFIIAEYTKDFQRAANVVGYEGEHIVLYHNDRRLFNKTLDHSKGGGHPILQ